MPRKKRIRLIIRGTRTSLMLDGEILPDTVVLAGDSPREYWGVVYSKEESARLLDIPIGQLLQDLSSICLSAQLDQPSRIFDVYVVRDQTRTTGIAFQWNENTHEWNRPYTYLEFLAETRRVVPEHERGPALKMIKGDHGDALELIWPTDCSTVADAIHYYEPVIQTVIELAEANLLARIRADTLVTHFTFPTAIRVAAQQYLLYFARFLGDLGIRATFDLREKAASTLFSVTPLDGNDALERVRRALDVFLEIPRSPIAESALTQRTDPAGTELRLQIMHLTNQVEYAKAILQAKDATIEALSISNYRYRQVISRGLGDLDTEILASAKKEEEELVPGVVSVKKYEVGPLVIDLPAMLRELKRR